MSKTTTQQSRIDKELASARNVAIVGFGNIGSGIVDILHNRKTAGLRLAKVVVKNTNKPRFLKIADELITTDIKAVIEDPRINILVELIGGVETAEEIVVAALRHGKDVVTANKALIAKKGRKIFSLASEQNRCVGFRGTFVGCRVQPSQTWTKNSEPSRYS
jgi:homoserine dehydrogenase